MSKHTPGPWTVELDVVRNGDVHVFAAEMFGVAEIDVREDQFDAGAPPMETALANARLISCAPDLLAAATQAHRLLIQLSRSGWQDDVQDAISILHTAIQKVEGAQ
jgi:hypothetical protein